jgi:HD-like signal output (HDOD) protein
MSKDLSMTPQQLVQEVDHLFSLPEIYFRIKQTIDHPKSTVDEVAAVVSQDPNISSRLLRMANSSYFGFATKIDTVNRAISIMGLAHLQNLVLAVSASKAFKGIDSELVNMKNFWIHSVLTASIAQILARKAHVLDSERLFVAGLLHDIGHLVIYTTLPTNANKVFTRAKNEDLSLQQVEKEMLGFDYAEVGGALLKHWKLPESLYLPIQGHTYLPIEDEFAIDCAIIHIANVMALRDPYVKTGFKTPTLEVSALQLTELTEEELEPIKMEAKKSMADILKLLFSA